jgi:cycloeucalenol cycloisomerase
MPQPPLAVTGTVAVPKPGESAVDPEAPPRDTERFLLAYSPVWMIVVAAVMLTRRTAAWGDAEHLALGVALVLPPWLYPLTRRAARADGGRPLAARYATHFAVAIAVTTLIQMYFGSALFFDQLGMEYHFHTRWVLNRSPVFLYLLTVAYFSTYYAVMVVLDRRLVRRLPAAWWPLARFVVCYAVAFAETYVMASDVIAEFFSYRDRRFALLVGSVGYGWLFFVTLPVFLRLAAAPAAARPPLRALVRDVLAANMLGLIGYEVFAHLIGKPL